MRIEGTSGVEPANLGGPQDPIAKLPQLTDEESFEGLRPDPQVKFLMEKYASKAARVEEIDLRAITDARELMKSGRLDTPEAIRRAAHAIFTLGA